MIIIMSYPISRCSFYGHQWDYLGSKIDYSFDECFPYEGQKKDTFWLKFEGIFSSNELCWSYDFVRYLWCINIIRMVYLQQENSGNNRDFIWIFLCVLVGARRRDRISGQPHCRRCSHCAVVETSPTGPWWGHSRCSEEEEEEGL